MRGDLGVCNIQAHLPTQNSKLITQNCEAPTSPDLPFARGGAQTPNSGALLHRTIYLPLLSDPIRHPDPSADGEGSAKR